MNNNIWTLFFNIFGCWKFSNDLTARVSLLAAVAKVGENPI